MFLCIKEIKKNFADLKLLKGINLSIKRSSVCAIIGESGSGKSTLLNLISTLDTPDSGSILFQGKDIIQMREYEKENFRVDSVGYLHQNHYLIPEFTVLENASFAPLIRQVSLGESLQRARHLLDLVGLAKRLSHYPHQLSGGEKSRLALVAALVGQKELILADEPTGNLDEDNAERIFDLILSLQNKFLFTLMVVSHNRQIVARVKTKFLLRDGVLNPLKGH